MQLGKLAAISMAAVMGSAMAGGTQAAAQEVTDSLTAVQQCLCAQRAVSILSGEMRPRNRATSACAVTSDAMTRQVDEARHRVNTDNRSDIEAFRTLLAHRDDAAQSLRGEDERYANAVARYNGAVERNNARLFRPAVRPRGNGSPSKPRLACPRP